jgi:hypothetical protein
MAYCVDVSPAAGVTGEVHATKQNELGIVRQFSDGFSYIYLQGIGSTVAGDWVAFDPSTFVTSRLATTSRGSVAVATAAVVASTYGWFGYIGSFSANCLSACASNLPIYPSGTAASATSVLTKNAQIQNAVARGAPVTTTGGGAQAVSINRPWVGAHDESV